MSDYVVMPKKDWQDILDATRTVSGHTGLLLSSQVSSLILNGGGGAKITTVHFKWNDGTVIGTTTTTEAEPWMCVDDAQGAGLGIYVGPKVLVIDYDDYFYTSPNYKYYGVSTQPSSNLVPTTDDWYKLTAGETYTFYVRFNGDTSFTVDGEYYYNAMTQVLTWREWCKATNADGSYKYNTNDNIECWDWDNTVCNPIHYPMMTKDGVIVRPDDVIQIGAEYTFYTSITVDDTEYRVPLAPWRDLIDYYELPSECFSYNETEVFYNYQTILDSDGNAVTPDSTITVNGVYTLQ